METATVNQIIAGHFYRQGLFEVGDCFVSEAMEPDSVDVIKSPYIEMYQIIEAMKNRNLELALKWASTNSSRMKERDIAPLWYKTLQTASNNRFDLYC